MKNVKKLIEQTIKVNYGLEGKAVDRLVDILIQQIVIDSLDGYLDVPYINEMLYAENVNGEEVWVDTEESHSRPNLDYVENELKEKYKKEFKLLKSCL